LEHVSTGEDEQFKDIPDLASELKVSFHAPHGHHVGIVCDVTKNEGDANGSELIVGVPREGIMMPHALREVNTFQRVDDNGGEHGEVVYGKRIAYECIVDGHTVRKTSAWYVVDFSSCPLRMSLVSIIIDHERTVIRIVWVAAPSLDDAFCVPVPKGVAVGTPHRGTTFSAQGWCLTAHTRFAVAHNHLTGGHDVLVALVLVIVFVVYTFSATRTRLLSACLADEPLGVRGMGGEEPWTISYRAPFQKATHGRTRVASLGVAQTSILRNEIHPTILNLTRDLLHLQR
jgi:hypothetical protein